MLITNLVLRISELCWPVVQAGA